MLKDSILKDNIIIKEFQNMPKVIIQKLSTELVGLLDKPILLINCTERLNWVFIDSKKPQIDFYQIKNNLLPIIKGKGGGKKLIWQGSGEIENKKEFSEKTKNYLTKLI
ncbi:MAG: hypothetical protein B6229_07735 [Spirochaetaceae bacterium 4572_7]|nr:MAG: hypothetical protein B6229_07735 [Spirochaetaceae bacterium 4572_7]